MASLLGFGLPRGSKLRIEISPRRRNLPRLDLAGSPKLRTDIDPRRAYLLSCASDGEPTTEQGGADCERTRTQRHYAGSKCRVRLRHAGLPRRLGLDARRLQIGLGGRVQQYAERDHVELELSFTAALANAVPELMVVAALRAPYARWPPPLRSLVAALRSWPDQFGRVDPEP
jgi:hypothetical protein